LVARFFLDGMENLRLLRCSECPAGSSVLKDCTAIADTVCDFEGCVGTETNPADSARRYSSIYSGQPSGVGHGQGRLDSVQAWSALPQNNVPNEFAQLDLGSPRPVSHVIIQPRHDGGSGSQRVNKFKVQYGNVDSDQASQWTFVDGGFEFDGPANGIQEDTRIKAVFKRVIVARFWRIVPTVVSGYMSLRWGVGACILLSPQDVCNIDFAVSRPTTQTSEGWGGVPSRPVAPGDGNSNWGGNTCSHTQNNPNEWWRVEFDGSKAINTVQVLNRSDCCRERLSGVEVRIGDSPNPNENEVCGAVSDDRAKNGDFKIEITCSRLIRGKYLFFAQRRNDYLTLCNVKALRKC